MKKKLLFVFAVICALLLVGCGDTKQEAQSDKPQVYCSFYGIYDFVSNVGGDKIDVYNMVPTGTEPHDWEPSTKDMANLTNADIIFYNGLGMESWVDKVKASVGDDVKFVELSQGIADENASDPHIWLNPKNAILMTEKIKDTLCEADAVYKDYYEKNCISLTDEITKVDEEYTKALSNVQNNKIVVAHSAYGYLCQAYGLEQIAIEGMLADSEPSPSKVEEIINTIKANDIKYIFYEELVSPKVAQTIAEESNVQLLELNPIEGLTDEQIQNGDNYITIMMQNLTNIKTALGVE